MNLFYAPDVLESNVLPEEESMHCVRVLRLGVGADVRLIDGKGTFYDAVIVQAHPKCCRVEIVDTLQDTADPCFGYVAVAPTKNMDRMEWFVEKATEIGVGGFSFIETRFSERKNLKLDRVEKIVVSAMKQSVKAVKPNIQGLTDFRQFVKKPFDGQKYICHCYPGEKPLLSRVCKPAIPVLILIGPEGDFSSEEVEMAAANGFVPVSLGSARLRTETAALVAVHIVQLKNQEQ